MASYFHSIYIGHDHELTVLGALAVYWNTDTELLGTGSGADFGAEAQGIPHAELMTKLKNRIELDEKINIFSDL